MKKSVFIVVLVLFAILAIGGTATAGQKGGTGTPATATFRDNCLLSSSCDYTLPYDRIGSDGHGPYINGVDGVKAIIDDVGDFDLDTNVGGGPTIRRLYLDFGAPATLGATAPFTSDKVDDYLSTGGGALTQMNVGDSAHVRLNVNFAAAGLGWFIRFNPTQYSGTSTVLVTRYSLDTWFIVAAPTDIGKLLSYPTKGKFVLTDHGNFFLPFLATVTLK